MSSDDSDSDAEQNQAVHAGVVETHWPNEDPDTLRILLSTDNHLGYAERDAVRGMDSFAAFEEVLYLAKKFNCDMVLIAGDLFHENRPSRRTLHKTMEILRRYCMGPEAVKLEFLSDAASQLRSALTVNYQDANYAVGLPLFSIHGNHDDPSRDQGGGELLAALDLLAISNLVDYFGRQDQVDKVEISPLLLQKGTTKIALYGLGSLRDERLNRMWEKKNVRFLRPEQEEDEDEDSEGFFNIFTLHQNRDLGRGAKNCVQESMIPDWMDIVVWGHEHECLIEFFESVVGTFRITQPGSSVATSLVSGEAARKKIGILDIRGKNFRLHPVPLTQVRSFVTTELSLREHRAELDPEDSKIEAKVSSVLEDEVRHMANSAREKMESVLNDARAAGNDAGEEGSAIKYKLQSPQEVLVRIRVEHNGFSTLNNQRFGAKFVGDVANPSDMLLFHRKKDPKLASKIKRKKLEPIAPEEIEQTNMEDLIKQHLTRSDGKMNVLNQKELSEAMEDYVDKSQLSAISDVAGEILKAKQKQLILKSTGEGNESMEMEKESQIMDILQQESQAQQDASMEGVEDEEDDQESQTAKSSKKRKTAASKGKENSMDLDDDDSVEVPKPRSKKAPAKKKKNALDSDDEDSFVAAKPAPKKAAASKKKKSAYLDSSDESSPAAPKSRAKKAPAAKKAKAAASRKNDFSDSEEISEDEEEVAKARAKPAPRSKRAKKTVTYAYADDDDDEEEDAIVDSDDDDDDDVLVVDEPANKRKKATSSRAKASTTKKTMTTSGTARSKKKTNTSRRPNLDDSDEEIEYVGTNSIDLEEDWGSAKTTDQFRG